MSPVLEKTAIAREVALDLPAGGLVNLGIGLPILVARHLGVGPEIIVHSENGIVGMGEPPAAGSEDWNLIDAGKGAVTLVRGGSYISHADSFALIRGGHIDVSVMGAMQVSGRGDLANWWTGDGIPGVGGAMDLAAGARKVVVIMRHVSPEGEPKIVPECTAPLTARSVVSRIYTEYGLFEPRDGELIVHGLAPEITVADLRAITGVPVREADRIIKLPRERTGASDE
ncbi:3-oxoacid CoA-transferase subunit B [soil metagenome]